MCHITRALVIVSIKSELGIVRIIRTTHPFGLIPEIVDISAQLVELGGQFFYRIEDRGFAHSRYLFDFAKVCTGCKTTNSNSRNIGLDGAAAMGWYEREGSNLCCWSRKEFVVRVSLIVTIAGC